MIDVFLRGVKEFKGELDKFDKKVEKARSDGIRVELYRLRNTLIKDIRASSVGGQKLEPLSFAARASSSGLKTRKPFTGLFSTQAAPSPGKGVVPVRYHEAEAGRRFELGFVDTKKEALSKSWKYLMNLHQSGGTVPVSESLRKSWRKRGAHWKKESPRSKLAKVFFLRKTTKSIKIPKRDMIAPFWTANKDTATRNIESNFDKKMRGEKI